MTTVLRPFFVCLVPASLALATGTFAACVGGPGDPSSGGFIGIWMVIDLLQSLLRQITPAKYNLWFLQTPSRD